MSAKCIHLNPDGPDGNIDDVSLVDPNAILSGFPNEKGGNFVNIDGKFDVGIWQADAYEERIDSYPVDEVMIIISGSASLTDGEGNTTMLKAGDVVFVEKGWSGTWKQTEPIRKFTVVYER